MFNLKLLKHFFGSRKNFPGILSRRDAKFDQKQLEALTTGATSGWDYCFVWCLMFKYFLTGHKWPAIATALREVKDADIFNARTGYVWSVSKLTDSVSKLLGVNYRIIELNRLKSLKALQKYIKIVLPRIYGKSHKIDWFVVVKYQHTHNKDVTHFCYVNRWGQLINPYPEWDNRYYKIVQWRIYRWYKK